MIRRQLRSTRTDTLSPNTTLFRSYFAANRRADWESDPVESEVYALDVAGGGVTALTDRNGPDANPLVSPDGGKIAYLGFDDKLRAYENNQLYVMNRDGSGKRSLTADWDYGIDAIEWAADGRSEIGRAHV